MDKAKVKLRIPLLIMNAIAIILFIYFFPAIKDRTYHHQDDLSLHYTMLVLPAVMLFAYLVGFYRNKIGQILLAVLYLFLPVWTFLLLMTTDNLMGHVGNFIYTLLGSTASTIVMVLGGLCLGIPFLTAGFWQLFSTKKNISVIISSVVSAVLFIANIISEVLRITDIQMNYYLVADIAATVFFCSIVLLSLFNKPTLALSIPKKTTFAPNYQMNVVQTPEMELKTLKTKLDNNQINKEEYDAQRAEIISKL